MLADPIRYPNTSFKIPVRSRVESVEEIGALTNRPGISDYRQRVSSLPVLTSHGKIGVPGVPELALPSDSFEHG